MALDVDQQELFDYIGHDGKRVLWPELKEPRCFQGHHIQEIIDYALDSGRYIVEILKYPLVGVDISRTFQILPDDKLEYRFKNHLFSTRDGVLILPTHAVAWDGTHVFDPKGMISDITQIYDDIKILFKVI